MKSILKCAAVVVAALLCASASSVYAAASIETLVTGTSYLGLADQATWLPQGDLVLEGSFIGGSLVNNGSISALAAGGTLTPAAYATLLSSFTALNVTGSGTVGMGTSYDGAIDITFAGSQASFGGTPVYLLAFNAATTAAATQVGVFTFPSNANNEYPTDMATGGSIISLDSASVLIGSSLAGLTEPYDTDQNFNGPNNDTMLSLDRVVSIPEPSSIMLVLVGLLGGIGMIRRRR